jgi:dTDP-glucose 4,6-dehydratase/UDP-glucose 4-epimerase
MKILIIGSKGFIGSHCSKYFAIHNEVWECDVVVDYVATNYLQLDATNADFSEIFQTQQFDVCINCSGAASVPDSLVHPFRDFTLNTINVYKILEAIRRFNPHCKFLNLSSAAVYGNPQELPIKEDHPLNPVSPYGCHKKQAETICREFYEFYGIKSCSLRIFSAYGNGLKKQLLWDLAQKMKNASAIELFGTGNESRDFINVFDLVKQIELVIDKAAFDATAINAANGSEISIKRIAEIFIEKLKWEGTLKFAGSSRKGDPINWVADIDVLRGFGYQQQIKIEKGIEEYLSWVQENA